MSEKIIYLGLKHAIHANINRALGKYKNLNHESYNFTESRLTKEILDGIRTSYMDEYGFIYREEQEKLHEIRFSSQYYNFRKVEEYGIDSNGVKICDVGGFYCGSAAEFLKRNPRSEFASLDFVGIYNINKGIKVPGLTFHTGYPLELLESFAQEGRHFDVVTFTRTAALINKEQLFSYMEVISKIAKRVLFLEVCNLMTYQLPSLNIAKIPAEKPVRMYKGMYVHGYAHLLKKYGYKVREIYWLNNKTFNQFFSPDHYFIYACGEK